MHKLVEATHTFECLLLILEGLARPQRVPEEDWPVGCGEKRRGQREGSGEGVCLGL